jgi:hypothetical protein
MADLSHARCYNHGRREAVARCMECGRFFCRECVTEHDGRLVCASCLARVTGAKPVKRRRLAVISRAAQLALGALVLWLFFYALGFGLLAIPSKYHAGDVWKPGFWDEGP